MAILNLPTVTLLTLIGTEPVYYTLCSAGSLCPSTIAHSAGKQPTLTVRCSHCRSTNTSTPTVDPVRESDDKALYELIGWVSHGVQRTSSVVDQPWLSAHTRKVSYFTCRWGMYTMFVPGTGNPAVGTGYVQRGVQQGVPPGTLFPDMPLLTDMANLANRSKSARID